MIYPPVSVVIPTHNRKKSIERLIKSILKSSYKNIEVIIINDASSDGTEDYLKRLFSKNKKIKIFTNKKNLYTAGSRNAGLKKTKGDLIFFIDDDNVLDKNAIKSLVDLFKDKKVGEAGPVNYNFNKKNQVLWFLTKRNMLTTKTYQPRSLNLVKRKNIWESDDIPNAFMVRGNIVRKNRIFFREKFGIMYEESDFAYRIKNLGYEILVSRNAKIYHDIETSEKGKKGKDYMFHFMEDKRRPYVFAKNRLIFHSLYSSKLELVFILLFWNWFFVGYYIYKILFYSGVGNYSFYKRFSLSLRYLKGVFDGLLLISSKNYEKKL